VNTATKRDNKQAGQFVLATENSAQWAKGNRRNLVLIGGLALLLILVLVGGYSLYEHRVSEAQTAFGEAMQIYQTPLVRPDQPLPPGMKAFNTAKERAEKANGKFVDVASRFGMTEPGKIAQYFAGVTYMEAGQNGPAEDTLKKVSSGWNGDTAALGKLGLAQLYAQTGRESQAVDMYQQLAKANATTVPPGLAQIQLAELYSSEGKNEQARQIYAQLKDHDKDPKGKPGVAGQIAAQKLNPQPAGPGAPGAAR
jgi:tetratricopeptide (TPR) repeat protein